MFSGPYLHSEQADFEDRSNLRQASHVLVQGAGVRVGTLRLLRVRNRRSILCGEKKNLVWG